MRPEVSVIVPTHNRPDFMKLAVESVLAQKAPVQGEVIIVFDACDIEIPELDVPQNWTVRGISNTRSRGLAGARNSGILAAEGDIVASLDDDDEWLPGKLEAQINRWKRDPDAVVIGTTMVVDDGSSKIVRGVPSEYLTHEDSLPNRIPGLHSSSLTFRRQALLDELGLIDEELPRSYGEDYDILLRSSALGKVVVVDEPLVNVRWQGQSFYFGQWAAYAEALQYLLAKHSDLSTIPKAEGRIQAQIAFALASSGQMKEAREWAQKALKNDLNQPKALLAILISYRLLTPKAVTRVVQKFGRGI